MPDHLRVLVISTDQSVCQLVQSMLDAEGHQATCVSSPQAALQLLGAGQLFELVVFDTSRQPPSNMYLLEVLARRAGNHNICLLSALGGNVWNRDAERLGIRLTFTKPFLRHDFERLLSEIGLLPSPSPRETAIGAAHECAAHAKDRPYSLEELPNGRFFLAASPAMMKIRKTIRLLAPLDVPVLILGESGVGKEVVSTLLHNASNRAGQGFLNVNCAALPSELLESELFGYEAGAFTGAIKAKPGKFELANKGTLLLDEIGEMSASMQAKLLHVLHDGHFSRLGARLTTQVDVRVLAATNIDMEAAIADHTFREDLYYRISAFTINIPPLRERREELPFFVEQMLRRSAITFHQEPIPFSPLLMEAVQEYSWPGNLRELSNFVIRTLILNDEQSALSDLHIKIRSCKRGAAAQQADTAIRKTPESMRAIVRDIKDQTESRLIQEALDAAGWNRRHAAVRLSISYRALLYKIQQYGLSRSAERLAVGQR